jgi:hypothetical protein
MKTRQVPRTAAASITAAVVVLLGAACGGGRTAAAGSATAAASAGSPSAVAYARCMRSHGVPDYPDPGGDGQLPKTSAQQLGVSGPRFQAAEQACQPRYPASSGSLQQLVQECETTGDCPQAVVQQALTAMRPFAQCMRSHGVPDFPDPTLDSEGRPFFNVSAAGLSRAYTRSAQFTAKDTTCERLVGGSAGVPVPMG